MDNEVKGKLVVISGPAGVGKGTVLSELFDLSETYSYSVSATTRKPRPGEIDGVNYFFLSEDEFLQRVRNGLMLEYVQYNGNYYGTPSDYIHSELKNGRSVILEIEVAGALNIKMSMPDSLMIFLTPPSYTELERRLRHRGTESEEAIKNRLEISKKEMEFINEYDYLIINDINMHRNAAEDINFLVNYNIIKSRADSCEDPTCRERERFLKITAEKLDFFMKNYY